MKQKSRKRKHKLPKGVYPNTNGCNYAAAIWDGRKKKHLGSFPTPEEAEYRRRWCLQRHHWEFFDDDPKYFGFIYLITNRKTGKMYIGSKQIWHWDGPPGGYKCTDPLSEWWDPQAWKESDWRGYTGSQQDLNEEIKQGNVWDFTYQVLKMCRTKLELHLSEVAFLIDADVLDALDENGEYLFYNKNIAGKEFRPPFNREQAKVMSEQTMNRVRNYYLKPLVCSKCGSVIPFGETKCNCGVTPVRVSGYQVGGGFEDVR